MTTNSQLSTKPKKEKQKQNKQLSNLLLEQEITRTRTESQKQRSQGGLSVGRGWWENGGKATGTKKGIFVP